MTDVMLHDEDKEVLINTLNKRGFILEKKVQHIINNLRDFKGIHKNIVIKGIGTNNLEWFEIDSAFHAYLYDAIIECKRTDYTWLFSKSDVQVVNIIFHERNTDFRNKPKIIRDFTVADSDIAIMVRDDSRLDEKDGYAKTSHKDIYEVFKQMMGNLNAYLLSKYVQISSVTGEHKFYLPLIITNAPLWIIEFDNDSIDDSGNLKKYKKLEQVPYLIYNRPFLLSFDSDDREESMKSVFIVNIKGLKEFIEKINRSF